MHTVNTISIRAPADAVFAAAADVARWPSILAHYRFVDVLFEVEPASDDRVVRVVKMGARRDRIPVSWMAVQDIRPRENRILYRHVAGVTRGMEVEWRIDPGFEQVEVSIRHELRSPRRWMRIPFIDRLVATVFVVAIADQTLAGIKQQAEAAPLTAAHHDTA